MLLVLNGLENTLVVNKFPSAEFTKCSFFFFFYFIIVNTVL